jgi:large subunit ribosomal protein L21
MYAVIKTGGKQYRVKPGDMLVVEKLAGEPGEKVAFDQVLMLGEGDAVTVGAPLVADAQVSATLIETRKGEKIKIFKKIRRQGYRRTRGHRQTESVFRVTAITGAGMEETWDGEIDLTPLAVLHLRARNLAARETAEATPEDVDVETVALPQGKGKAARVRAAVVEHADAVVSEPEATDTDAPETGAEAPAKKTPAKKAGGAPKSEGFKNVAGGKAPKASKSQAKAPPVRRSAPRGKG